MCCMFVTESAMSAAVVILSLIMGALVQYMTAMRQNIRMRTGSYRNGQCQVEVGYNYIHCSFFHLFVTAGLCALVAADRLCPSCFICRTFFFSPNDLLSSACMDCLLLTASCTTYMRLIFMRRFCFPFTISCHCTMF